jgi:hypothetical protein
MSNTTASGNVHRQSVPVLTIRMMLDTASCFLTSLNAEHRSNGVFRS